MNKVLDIVTSKGLTYEQKVVALAHAAENSLEVLEIPEISVTWTKAMRRTGQDISCRITKRR